MTDRMPAQPHLVMIHALGADARMWDDCVAFLSDAFRCHTPDLSGVGDAPRHSRPRRASDHADMLLPRVAQLDGPIVLVGCAVGSMVAAELAARLESRAAGLVMANPILRITGPAGDVLMDRARRARAGGIAAIENEVLERSFEGIDPARRDAFGARLHRIGGDAYADLAEGICGGDIAPALARIACPILLVPGGLDRILPDWHPVEIAQTAPQAQTVSVASGAHFMPQQAPEAFVRAVRPFLDRVTAATP